MELVIKVGRELMCSVLGGGGAHLPLGGRAVLLDCDTPFDFHTTIFLDPRLKFCLICELHSVNSATASFQL